MYFDTRLGILCFFLINSENFSPVAELPLARFLIALFFPKAMVKSKTPSLFRTIECLISTETMVSLQMPQLFIPLKCKFLNIQW